MFERLLVWLFQFFGPIKGESPDFDYAETLTKADLDAYAETWGVKLDRRKTKALMLEQFRASV